MRAKISARACHCQSEIDNLEVADNGLSLWTLKLSAKWVLLPDLYPGSLLLVEI